MMIAFGAIHRPAVSAIIHVSFQVIELFLLAFVDLLLVLELLSQLGQVPLLVILDNTIADCSFGFFLRNLNR